MSSLIEFTNNYQDKSTPTGYQFEFYCDGCGHGLCSPFKPSKVGIAGSLLSQASGFLGGFGSQTEGAQELLRGKERDGALRESVQEMKSVFKRCGRCGKWVCPEACWNDKKNMCEKCAPDLDEELAAAQNTVTSEHIWRKARNADMAANYDPTQSDGRPAVSTTCACGATVTGKFCGSCGAEARRSAFCSSCGTQSAPGAKFCASCGNKVGD